MLYLHPEDKTKEHTYIVVNTPEEKDDALDKGYKVNPHIPGTEEQFEENSPVAEIESPETETTEASGDAVHTEEN